MKLSHAFMLKFAGLNLLMVIIALAVVAASAPVAHAAGTVSTCGETSLNTAFNGGGALVYDGALTVIDSDFYTNTAAGIAGPN